MNKMDLASGLQIKAWRGFFEQQNSTFREVNSHNKDSIRELLNFLQARVRELKKADDAKHTFTAMLVGIPNVGKSALANSLHQIGRISAAEKGKLKHTTVSPMPGETRDISSLKIASHPNIYVLDTPGILPREITNAEVCSKLALTGAIDDHLIGEGDLAKYFLSILYSSDEYNKWEKFSSFMNEKLLVNNGESSGYSDKRMKQYATDHTQDFIVHNVRRAIFDTISSFRGDLENEKDLMELIEVQFSSLLEAFQMNLESDREAHCKVSAKLLNLYRTGRLGHYTLDAIPSNS